MIISASRRTDIPTFYSEWFMNRIRENYCTWVNPYNSKRVSRISLSPEDVDVIVFWTKNAGIRLIDDPTGTDSFKELMKNMSSYAMQNGMKIYSCAEPIDLREYGIGKGKCIDDEYTRRVFDIDVKGTKDRNHRKECGCIESKVIFVITTELILCSLQYHFAIEDYL